VSAPRPAHADRSGVALTALSAAFFGSLAVYGKFADRMGITTTELLAVRFGVAAAILWVVAVARREKLWWGRRTLGLALMGLLYVGQAAARRSGRHRARTEASAIPRSLPTESTRSR
jgi:drug/metabolite transporter (DMT)-like permease